jgi:Rps23 Pro-64 3,4-dihydroxylase Tpa1-like proline 4-hydroxylase
VIHLGHHARFFQEPFPHATASNLLPQELCGLILDWMETEAPWKLRVASFYEQWEMHVNSNNLPLHLRAVCAPSTVDHLSKVMLAPLSKERIELADVTAHKLVSGQTIRVHNDFLDGTETHRLLLQLNRGWADDQGGMLMLFSGPSPEDVRRVIRPLNGSAMAFPISPRSFHAVSTIRAGERFTLVFSFKRSDPCSTSQNSGY